MKKVQKVKVKSNTSVEASAPSRKRAKVDNIFSSAPTWPEGTTEETARGQKKDLLAQLKKKPRDFRLAKDFMERTYVLRRRDILLGDTTKVSGVIKDYPPLGQFVHVS